MMQSSMHPGLNSNGEMRVEIREHLLESGVRFRTVRIGFDGDRNTAVFFPTMELSDLLQMFPTASVERDLPLPA